MSSKKNLRSGTGQTGAAGKKEDLYVCVCHCMDWGDVILLCTGTRSEIDGNEQANCFMKL